MMFTDTQFFIPKKIVVLSTDVILLVLFQFGFFALSVEAFKQFTPKVCILVQMYLI